MFSCFKQLRYLAFLNQICPFIQGLLDEDIQQEGVQVKDLQDTTFTRDRKGKAKQKIKENKNKFKGQTWDFGEGAATKAWRAVLSGGPPTLGQIRC